MDHARVGDTITGADKWENVEMLPGYSPAKQMVFCGLYPSESDDYERLRDAIGTLTHSLSHSLTHSHTHTLTHSLTNSLTHSLIDRLID